MLKILTVIFQWPPCHILSPVPQMGLLPSTIQSYVSKLFEMHHSILWDVPVVYLNNFIVSGLTNIYKCTLFKWFKISSQNKHSCFFDTFIVICIILLPVCHVELNCQVFQIVMPYILEIRNRFLMVLHPINVSVGQELSQLTLAQNQKLG